MEFRRTRAAFFLLFLFCFAASGLVLAQTDNAPFTSGNYRKIHSKVLGEDRKQSLLVRHRRGVPARERDLARRESPARRGGRRLVETDGESSGKPALHRGSRGELLIARRGRQQVHADVRRGGDEGSAR